jgi:hypothetical protein
MNDEPNTLNHRHDYAQQEPEAHSSPLEDVEALTGRLAADGAVWRSRLPDPAHVAERIRAIADEAPPSHGSEGEFLMFEDNTGTTPEPDRPTPRASRPALLVQRLGNLVAVAVVVALVGSMTLVFYVVHGMHGGGRAPSTQHPSSSSTATTTTTFNVTSVSMAVTPQSIAGISCGSLVTVTYTATIQIAAKSSGGTIQFNYTVNNGRGETPASLTVAPGETSKSYSFTWSGALPADHTYPAQGGIQVTSPNQVTSSLVAPTGQCTPVTPPTCGSNFSGSLSQTYQSTINTAYGVVPLPSYSRTVPNDASGGVRGYDICSAGTAASITTFMEQNLPAYGWTLVSKSGGTETWKGNGGGVINWNVPDPLEWNINWRVPLG